MYYEVFIDVLFWENLIADFAAIHLTQQILYQRKRYWRSFLGASMGAVSAVVRMIWPPRLQIVVLLFYLICCMGAMLISFAKVRQLFLQICCVHGLLMLMAAGLFLIKRMLRWHNMSISSAGYTGYVILFYMAGLQCIHRYRKWCCHRRKKLYPVWIYFDWEPVCTKALLDTGNQLRDPASGKPVSIVESSVCRQKQHLAIPAENYCSIPFRSIGQEQGILHAVRVPRLKIELEGKTIEHTDAVIAIYQGHLSRDMSFQMILQPELLQT